MDALLSPRQRVTALVIFLSPSRVATPSSIAARDRNVIEVEATAPPNAANIGRYRTGWGVGIEALGSPMAAVTISPPFRTNSGLTPKKAGFHRTRSASFPVSTEPTSWAMPWAMAGLMVYLAT